MDKIPKSVRLAHQTMNFSGAIFDGKFYQELFIVT